MMNSVRADWTWNTWCLQIFSCSTGTYVGGWLGAEWQTERSARQTLARTLSVPLSSHGNHLQPVSVWR